MDGYEYIQGDEAWIRVSDVIWQVRSLLGLEGREWGADLLSGSGSSL
jgi:hypothetical protein